MDDSSILLRLGLALAIGFLIGVERGWREREEGEGERAAGLRTFALIGLFGGVWGLLSKDLGPVPLGFAFFALAGAVTFFRWREAGRGGDYGMTTVVAAFLTFSLGAYAVLGDMVAAAAAAVAAAALLAAKEWLHAWLKVLTWTELRAALVLLAMTFVALPVLPDQGYGPYDALNPRSLWLMTIVIAGVSFMGYVAVKLAGARYGTLITGIAGGVVSSTATTLALARQVRAAPGAWRHESAGALAASAVMFVRVGVVVALFGASLLPRVILPLAAAFVVTILVAIAIDPPWRKAKGKAAKEETYTNPFELRAVLAFGLLLAAVIVATRALTEAFGGEGVLVLAAIAGIADVDAITLSMTGLPPSSSGAAGIAILIAVATNSLSKSFLAVAVGGMRFGGAYLAASLAALAAGGVVVVGWGWG